MNREDRQVVLEKLQDLEGWADFILQSLTVHPAKETKKEELLDQTLEKHSLKRLRELSWSLWEHLHRITIELQHSHALEDAMT
jgi:hypothetical protein